MKNITLVHDKDGQYRRVKFDSYDTKDTLLCTLVILPELQRRNYKVFEDATDFVKDVLSRRGYSKTYIDEINFYSQDANLPIIDVRKFLDMLK